MVQAATDEYVVRIENCIPKLVKALRWTVPRHLMGVNLSFFQGLVLLALKEGRRGLKMSQIGDETGIKPTTLTQVVDSLEKNRFVERRRTPKDRRVCLVHLTRKGRRLLKQIEQHRRKLITQVIESLDPDETENLVRAFEKVTSILLEKIQKSSRP